MGGLHAQGMCCGEGTSSQTISDKTSEVLGTEDKTEWVKMPASLENNLPATHVCLQWTLDRVFTREEIRIQRPFLFGVIHSVQDWIAKPISFMNSKFLFFVFTLFSQKLVIPGYHLYVMTVCNYDTSYSVLMVLSTVHLHSWGMPSPLDIPKGNL